jgi:hypothetical protein
MKNLPNRRPCITQNIGAGLAVTVSFHPATGDAVEVFMTERGKASDNEMTNALYNLGVTASKMMQGEWEQDNEREHRQAAATA